MFQSHNSEVLLVVTKNSVKWQKNSLSPAYIHDNKFVTDFSKNLDLFNSCFVKQCSIIENISDQLIPLPISTWQTLNS